MNIFKRGDIVRIRDEYIKNHPNLSGLSGRISSVNGEICTTIFKDRSPNFYDFHYTKLDNPKILRNRKIEIILND